MLNVLVHLKMNAENCLGAVQDVDEFVSSSGLEKCVSAMDVNGCRQNASLIKTSQ